jgi:hypothetical protein
MVPLRQAQGDMACRTIDAQVILSASVKPSILTFILQIFRFYGIIAEFIETKFMVLVYSAEFISSIALRLNVAETFLCPLKFDYFSRRAVSICRPQSNTTRCWRGLPYFGFPLSVFSLQLKVNIQALKADC